ncbi:hypothetical protein O6H91_03G049900 [Diphasiastrum complanatum]|uniref:Uncharacterized protein n=1 Tax=Diphasiastrum complanatum TaxID=34168 RepID=A0ACC2E5X9_DIPCM|nr:hypothetical protein O6H91_03G049900 [Diphasiastrum complanatum]
MNHDWKVRIIETTCSILLLVWNLDSGVSTYMEQYTTVYNLQVYNLVWCIMHLQMPPSSPSELWCLQTILIAQTPSRHPHQTYPPPHILHPRMSPHSSPHQAPHL